MVSAIDDLFTVTRPERAAVVAKLTRQPSYVFAIRIHSIDIQITTARRSENQLSLTTNGGLRVITGNVRQLLQIRSVRISCEDVVRGVECPDVSLREVRPRRTISRGKMC